MNFLAMMSRSLVALLLCLLVGGMAGVYLPDVGNWAYVVGQVYLALVSMAALPLLLVATFFGLRQVIGLPFPVRRVLMIIGVAFLMVAVSAGIGLALGLWASPGSHLDASVRAKLGALVLQVGGDGSNTEMFLVNGVDAPKSVERYWSDFFPNNFFRVLVEGRSLGILSCALLFGLAFAALTRGQSLVVNQLFEGIYRTLEIIIARANMLLPVVAFGVAAHIFSTMNLEIVGAMGVFLAYFVAVAILLSAGLIAIVRRRTSHGLAEVLHHLKAPMLVSLVSSSTTATIPHMIEAMSARLGFSRGIVEFVVPTASVYLRAGSALYYVLLTTFVANLYNLHLTVADMGLVFIGSTLASFASAGQDSLTNVGFVGIVLGWLQLPMEAALALFLAIDLICQGPRNLVTLLAACALIAIVSTGLPSERSIGSEDSVQVVPASPLQFVVSRDHLFILTCGSLLLAGLIILMGIIVGMRQTQSYAAASKTLSPVSTSPESGNE